MAFGTPGMALIRRELLSTLRRPRSFVVLTLFVGACIAGIAMAWPNSQHLFIELSALSNMLVRRISTMLFAACVLLVPALAAGAIVVEREEDTMDLLRVTLIRPSALLLAKLVSVVGFFLLLLVAAIPVFATVFFLVGLEWTTLFEVVAVLVTLAVTCAAAGLLSSASNRNISRAVFGSYLWTLLVLTLSPMLALLVGAAVEVLSRGRLTFYSVQGAMTAGTPNGILANIFAGGATVTQVLLAVALQLGFAGLCLVLALGALRRTPGSPRWQQVKPIDDPRRLRERRLTFPFYLVDPLRRKKPIEDGRNPVFVRELRWGLLDRADTLIRTFYIAFFTYLIIGGIGFMTRARGASMEHQFIIGWLLAQIAGTVLVAPALLANTLTREYESGNIDMLRTTLLTPGDIIRGKLFAGFTAAAPLLLAAAGSCLPLLRALWGETDLLVTGYVTLLLCASVCLALALFASLLTTHTTNALVLTYLFTLAAFLGTWGIFIVLPFEPGEYIQCLKSPILVFMENADKRGQGTAFTAYWFGNVLVFATGVVALVGATIHGFTRYRLRDV